MATTTTNLNARTHSALDRLLATTGAFFSGIGTSLVKAAEADRRIRTFNALMEMSDAELAAKGLKREDLARHVFGDLYYI